MENTSTPVGGRRAPAGPTVADLHDEIQRRLIAQLERVPRPLRAAADELYDRLGVLTAERTAFAHPLIQPLVTFPLWVADSCGVSDETDLVSDLVESSLMGYLYVRVHDDHFDEGRGDPATVVYLADSFLVRHQSLLAEHTSASRYWAFHTGVARRFAEAMLLERTVLRADAEYGEAEFDRVLGRSEPLVLPGALLFDRVDRWDEVGTLLAFVHHVVRAGQIVDDVIDCDRDVALGNHTWVARRLGVADDRSGLRALLTGGLEEMVAIVRDDLDRAAAAAGRLRLDGALPWLAERRTLVESLARQIVQGALGVHHPDDHEETVR